MFSSPSGAREAAIQDSSASREQVQAQTANRPFTSPLRFPERLRLSKVDREVIFKRLMVTLSFLGAFLLLNHPAVILLSQLGTVVWYPAAGLSLALLLGLGPSYAILVAAGDAVAGKIFYGQSYLSYGETIGALGMAVAYGGAAYVLRDRLKIDLGLRRRADVFHYVAVTTCACFLSTVAGVACLAADHSIPWRSFANACLLWFLGDEIALLGVSPALLIHVFPWIRRVLAKHPPSHEAAQHDRWHAWTVLELVAQGAFLLLSLWLAFSPTFGLMSLMYIGFVPVIWIAIRQGIKRVVSALLILNFGVVFAAHLFAPDRLMLTQYRLFMFVLSGVGLIVGSAITERHRIALELLDAKQRAEEANRIKSQFLANMSHEIRTPINGVLGMAELVLDSDPTEEQREYLEILKSSGDFLSGVINDVLDFSRMEAGKLAIEELEFDLHDLVRDTLKSLSLPAHEKGLDLAYQVRGNIPARLLGDPSRLRQILLNLVGNALKFTPSGEVILEVELRARERHNVVLEFAVRDTGIGIPAQKQRLIFEPFVQADSSTTRTYGGSGLGLSICSRLVRLMGGELWLTSTEGKGSTFYFTVPLRCTEHDTGSAEPSAHLSSTPILIIDNNAEVRRILSDTTREWGMRPVTASNQEVAFELLRGACDCGQPIPIALLDGGMWERHGFELTERIRQDVQLSNVALVLTAYPGKRQPPSFYRNFGIAARLLKPVGPKELRDTILRVLAERTKVGQVTEKPFDSPDGPPLTILVADDNAINQVVALKILERLGHNGVPARNGAEALACLQSTKFDLVLMDVQMPIKDGLTATREIRQRERETGAHIPIVAVTAHALKGDRERCLAAGMDAYLTKPIGIEGLRQVIRTVCRSNSTASASSTKSLTRNTSWNTGKLKEAVEDEALLRDILHIFAEETPKKVAALEAAIETGDAQTIEQVAHTLKGELSYLGLTETATQARDLERFGHEHSLVCAAALFQEFKTQLMAAVLSAHDMF